MATRMKRSSGMELKEISEAGSFEGLLSPYGNVDDGGDVVIAGAFAKTLNEQGPARPLLWQHKTDTPIGEIVLEDRVDGLYCKGQLMMELPAAQVAYALIKKKLTGTSRGIVSGLSIGFDSIKDVVEKGVRKLLEVKLYEGSIVTFPLNVFAQISTVKAMSESKEKHAVKGDFNEELNEWQLGDAGYQMRCALQNALCDVTWSDLTREEKITATETIIQQFADAYMAYYPLYLDMMSEEYGAMETWSQKRFETKEGRRFSAATKESMKAACEQIKGGHEAIVALLEDTAAGADTTSDDESKAGSAGTAKAKAAHQPEPAEDHSAATALIGGIKALIPA